MYILLLNYFSMLPSIKCYKYWMSHFYILLNFIQFISPMENQLCFLRIQAFFSSWISYQIGSHVLSYFYPSIKYDFRTVIGQKYEILYQFYGAFLVFVFLSSSVFRFLYRIQRIHICNCAHFPNEVSKDFSTANEVIGDCKSNWTTLQLRKIKFDAVTAE